jgi:hypothetical protein
MVPFPKFTTGVAIVFAMAQLVVSDRPPMADAATPTGTLPREEVSQQDPGSRAHVTPALPRFVLHFTAPVDGSRPDSSGHTQRSPEPVRSYEFLQVDASGNTTYLRGYTDSLGSELLIPHPAGTRETVWLEATERDLAKTIFVLSRGWSGRPSLRSNGAAIAAVLRANTAEPSARLGRISLPVPVVAHRPERSGEAALEMVMRYYGADSGSVREACGGDNPASRPSNISSLAAAARRAGYAATVATLTPDSLIALVSSRVPPIVLFQNSPDSSASEEFGVVAGWDSTRDTFTLHDGGARAQVVGRAELARRWRIAGSKALVVRRDLAMNTGGSTGP